MTNKDFSTTDAFLMLQKLNAALLSESSATRVLEQWSQSHGHSEKIIAEPSLAPAKTKAEDARIILGIQQEETLNYRHVVLRCGQFLLSHAENWYIPQRLAPGMEDRLNSTHDPFGLVVSSLDFSRQTTEVTFLWQPERSSPPPPEELLRHRAILKRADGVPFSYVTETYTRQILPS
ncbi:MAG: hypothetical protein GX413_01235 [Acetobacter sp.]|nr:hypothetical protein [Acetobacter sp.]